MKEWSDKGGVMIEVHDKAEAGVVDFTMNHVGKKYRIVGNNYGDEGYYTLLI